MRWIPAISAVLVAVSIGAAQAQAQGQGQPPAQPAKPAASPGQPGDTQPAAPGIPTLKYPTIEPAPQIAMPDVTSLLGIRKPEDEVKPAPTMAPAQRQMLGLQMLTLPVNSLAPRRLEMLTLPILSFAPRSTTPAAAATAAPADAAAANGPTYLTLPTAPAFYLPSPVMPYATSLEPAQLTVAYLPSPLLNDPTKQDASTLRPPQPDTSSDAGRWMGLGLGMMGGLGTAIQGIWQGLGQITGGIGATPTVPTAPNVGTVPQPNLPNMRY